MKSHRSIALFIEEDIADDEEHEHDQDEIIDEANHTEQAFREQVNRREEVNNECDHDAEHVKLMADVESACH